MMGRACRLCDKCGAIVGKWLALCGRGVDGVLSRRLPRSGANGQAGAMEWHHLGRLCLERATRLKVAACPGRLPVVRGHLGLRDQAKRQISPERTQDPCGEENAAADDPALACLVGAPTRPRGDLRFPRRGLSSRDLCSSRQLEALRCPQRRFRSPSAGPIPMSPGRACTRGTGPVRRTLLQLRLHAQRIWVR